MFFVECWVDGGAFEVQTTMGCFQAHRDPTRKASAF
jgi:hypothetical protein